MADEHQDGIPRDRSPDSTLAFLARGYTFVSERCRQHGTDAFETRLMLRPVVCALGADAARVFYQPDRFTRRNAMPETTLRLLQDKGSVQQLQGEAHRVRKRLFMDLMTPEARQRLLDIADEEWRSRIAGWPARDPVVLLAETEEILCRAVCRWSGVPLPESEAARRTAELSAMIEGAGGVGPRTWRALWLRRRSEAWLRQHVERVRGGALDAPPGTALAAIAGHRDADGAELDAEAAAVELLNVLRPTVAVARFVAFAALALHEHPEIRDWLAGGDDEARELFVQEVRRYYPFFPGVGGRVRVPFEWRGRRFEAGEWMLLDLYGTNHDRRLWDDPEAFRPERFRTWDGDRFGFVPQGGGNYEDGHRCPGEWIVIDLLKQAAGMLTEAVRYEVPAQDLTVDLARMPAQPASGFRIAGVRPIG